MAAINYNLIKKCANNLGLQQQIDRLYDETIDYINFLYVDIKEQLLEIDKMIQEILTDNCESEDQINKLCENYVKVNESLFRTFNIQSDCDLEFKEYFKGILETYAKASGKFCGCPDEAFKAMSCLYFGFRKKYNDWVTENVISNADELTTLHNNLDLGLSYIFNKIRESESISEKIIAKKKEQLKYIPDCKELERIALENNYVFKSQTGSHKKYEHKETHNCIIIPFHNNDLKLGTSLAIRKQILENAIA